MYRNMFVGDSLVFHDDGNYNCKLYYKLARKNGKSHEIKPNGKEYIFKPKSAGEYSVYAKVDDQVMLLTIALVAEDRMWIDASDFIKEINSLNDPSTTGK